MGDPQRAKDHYKWADRYMRYGDTQKAAAHMKRALHYAPKPKSRFGTPGSTPDTGAGPAPMNVPREDKDTDLIFVLAPLNQEAANRIRSSLRQSIREGKKVEVYMQAFTENEPGSPITAPNLLPMNFNQYSSDHPGVLVDIINEFKDHTEVSFYIFPTQTTKNAHFWSRAAKQKLVDMLKEKKDKVDPWILMAIVTWLLKDGDVESTDYKDEKRQLHRRFEDLHGTNGDINVLLNKFTELSKPDPKKPPTHETDAIQTVFDPFCVHCAAYKSSGSVPFSDVPGSGNLNAAPVYVEMNADVTEDEVNKGFKDDTHVRMIRPRIKKTEKRGNCYRVGWDTADSIEHAKIDGTSYMDSLLVSVCDGDYTYMRRIVNRILFIQDFYDYDNKFSVWYALLTIGASVFELFSVCRPVANKELMKKLRNTFKPFSFDTFQSPLGKGAAKEWGLGKYPPAAPVYTKDQFDASRQNAKEKLDKSNAEEQSVKRDVPYYDEVTFDKYKQAIYADHSRESLEDSKKIALTWYVFLCYMMRKGLIANTQMQMSVVNGGYTNHHRFNPAMHTTQEDWVSDADVTSPQTGLLYNLFGINMPVIVPSNTKYIDTILGELKLNDLPRAAPVASGFGYSRQRF